MVCVGRDGTQDDPDDADGSGWSVLDGKFIQVAVGSGAVWGLGANREFFYRCGLYIIVPQKVASELHPKVRNHGEGPY